MDTAHHAPSALHQTGQWPGPLCTWHLGPGQWPCLPVRPIYHPLIQLQCPHRAAPHVAHWCHLREGVFLPPGHGFGTQHGWLGIGRRAHPLPQVRHSCAQHCGWDTRAQLWDAGHQGSLSSELWLPQGSLHPSSPLRHSQKWREWVRYTKNYVD